MTGNLIKWKPNESHFPMTHVETRTFLGSMLVITNLSLSILFIYGLLRLINEKDDIGGIILTVFFLLVSLLFILWGIYSLTYRKTVVLNRNSITIKIRTLWEKIEKKFTVKEYAAICRMEKNIRWAKYHCLILPHPEPRFTVYLAGTKAKDKSMDLLHDHFSKLLDLPQADYTKPESKLPF